MLDLGLSSAVVRWQGQFKPFLRMVITDSYDLYGGQGIEITFDRPSVKIKRTRF